jgi:hypothetical protein
VAVKANVKEKAPVWPGLTAVGERRQLKDEGVVCNVCSVLVDAAARVGERELCPGR